MGQNSSVFHLVLLEQHLSSSSPAVNHNGNRRLLISGLVSTESTQEAEERRGVIWHAVIRPDSEVELFDLSDVFILCLLLRRGIVLKVVKK